ncbi:hypothetical protein E2C01_077822 [Portunus trituberculatus]|uniref:Uncharacterized protein n=1 Tax=Portunus trituberculatus TaxID=210409 RepID=A0A5B7IMC6_PORTR|nr:hypothetical protein [Portunus trituberculatus]
MSSLRYNNVELQAPIFHRDPLAPSAFSFATASISSGDARSWPDCPSSLPPAPPPPAWWGVDRGQEAHLMN